LYTVAPFSEAVIAAIYIQGLPAQYQGLKDDIKNSSWLDASGKRVGSGPPTIQEAFNRAYAYQPPKYFGEPAYAMATKVDPKQLREGGNKGSQSKGKAAAGKPDARKTEKGKETPATGKNRWPCSVCNATDHATHTCPHLEGVKTAVEKHIKSESAAGKGAPKPFTGATDFNDPDMLAVFDNLEHPS